MGGWVHRALGGWMGTSSIGWVDGHIQHWVGGWDRIGIHMYGRRQNKVIL